MTTRTARTVAAWLLPLALLAPIAAPAAASQKAGVAAAVNGDVQLSRLPEIVGQKVESGEPIFLEDRITAGPGAGLQILLLDETVFTIGPNSEITIDTFVFDPDTDAGEVTATVTKGVFRFITGRVAQNKPSNMEVKVPFGTIGVRGTIVAGQVAPDGTGSVVLLGPGGANTTSETIGRIEVANAQGTVSVTRPGFGTRLGPGGAPPTPPALVPPAAMAQLTGALSAPPPPPLGAPPPPGGGEAGQQPPPPAPGGEGAQLQQTGTTGTGGPGGQQTPTPRPINIGGNLLGPIPDPGTGSEPIANPIPEPFRVADGPTQLADLDVVQGGVFSFDHLNVPFGDGPGSYSLHYLVNFDNRQFGGGDSRITFNATTIPSVDGKTVDLLNKDFSTLTSGGVIEYGGTTGVPIPTSTYKTNVTLNFVNTDGAVARQLDHQVVLKDGGGTPVRHGGGSVIHTPGPPTPP